MKQRCLIPGPARGGSVWVSTPTSLNSTSAFCCCFFSLYSMDFIKKWSNDSLLFQLFYSNWFGYFGFRSLWGVTECTETWQFWYKYLSAFFWPILKWPNGKSTHILCEAVVTFGPCANTLHTVLELALTIAGCVITVGPMLSFLLAHCAHK